ncbi:hypothetical protein HAX54_034983, partial [Datura stramonium]|nr:hypothetical protein [Datura stramonium]
MVVAGGFPVLMVLYGYGCFSGGVLSFAGEGELFRLVVKRGDDGVRHAHWPELVPRRRRRTKRVKGEGEGRRCGGGVGLVVVFSVGSEGEEERRK